VHKVHACNGGLGVWPRENLEFRLSESASVGYPHFSTNLVDSDEYYSPQAMLHKEKQQLVNYISLQKWVGYFDNNVFLTRIATVDMVLWDDTRIVPCDNQQYSAHGVATGTTEYATRAGSLLKHQIGAICSQRELFPSVILVM